MTDAAVYKIDRGIPIARLNLHPNPWNPNRQKPREQAAIAESVKEYGQVLELLVRPHPETAGEYQIIDGEHRFNVLPETVYCNIIHGLPDAHAKKLTIVMNETRGEADKVELAKLLADISADLGNDLGLGLPYEANELDELIKLADVDWDSFNSDFEAEIIDGDNPTSGGFTMLTVKVPTEAMDVLDQAWQLISDDRALHKDRAIAWGQVFESIAADYLASPH